jgi:hypothetical protein
MHGIKMSVIFNSERGFVENLKKSQFSVVGWRVRGLGWTVSGILSFFEYLWFLDEDFREKSLWGGQSADLT